MSEIKAALTAEEWSTFDVSGFVNQRPTMVKYIDGDVEVGNTIVPAEHLHALAALCLHGQPFGFTWEDVEEVRSCALGFRCGDFAGGNGEPYASRLDALADRIAALLPPEDAA